MTTTDLEKSQQDALAKITQYQEDLAQLAEWIRQHPEVEGYLLGSEYFITTDFYVEGDDGKWLWRKITPGEMAAIVRAMKDLTGAVAKEGGDNYMSYVARCTHGRALITMSVEREAVCTRKVTGVRIVEVTDPDAPKIKKAVDVVEWECSPLLASAEAD